MNQEPRERIKEELKLFIVVCHVSLRIATAKGLILLCSPGVT